MLVCSDGLWNYVTEADELRAMIGAAVADGASGPLMIAESLAALANEQGGHDNVTVALARLESSAAHPLTEGGDPFDPDEPTKEV